MISIVIPVYNVAPYLSACLDSVVSQSYPDWELILVDDGSSDDSPLICDEYAARHERIHVFHQSNGGPSKARNFGLSKCSGDYVAFIDSDDLLHVQYLEQLVRVIEAEQADIVQTSYVLLREQDRQQYTPERLRQTLSVAPKKRVFAGHEAIRSMLYQREMDSSPIKLYRREVLPPSPFPEQIFVYEDLYGLLSVYARCQKCCWVDLPVYYYFKRMDGTLNAGSLRDGQALSVMDQVQTWIESYDPALLPAVRSRRLSMAFNMLRLLSHTGIEKHKPLAAQCWQVVKTLRKDCLFDRHMRLKNKLGILLSYLGQRALISVFSRT